MHDGKVGGVAQGGGHLRKGRHLSLFAAAIDRNRLPQMCGANPFAPDILGGFAEKNLSMMEKGTS